MALLADVCRGARARAAAVWIRPAAVLGFVLAATLAAWAQDVPKQAPAKQDPPRVEPGIHPVQIELFPASIDLRREVPREVLVVARNTSPAEARNVVLSCVTGGRFAATVAGGASALGPGAASTWRVQVQEVAGLTGTEELAFLLEYDIPVKDAGNARQAVSKLLKVQFALPTAAADLVDVTAHSSSVMTISEARPGSAYLAIRNKTDQELEVGPIQCRHPAFLTVRPPNAQADLDKLPAVRLGAGRTHLVDLQVAAADRVRPGKHLLIFEIPVVRPGPTSSHRGSVVVQREFDVEVIGESAVLTALGVPSFILLPGFLMIASAQILWTIGFRRRTDEKTAFPFPAKGAEFWVVAVLLSIGACVAYQLILEHSYLTAYGTQDVATVWVGSVVVGVAIYSVVMLWLRARLAKADKLAAAAAARRIVPGDDTLTVLRKLGELGLDTKLVRVTLKSAPASAKTYLAEPRDDPAAAGSHTVIPHLLVSAPHGTTSDVQKALADLIKDGKAGALAKWLESHETLPRTWVPAGTVIGPAVVSLSDVEGFGDPEPAVTVNDA